MEPAALPSATFEAEALPRLIPTTSPLPDLPTEVLLSIFDFVLGVDGRESPLAQRQSARRLSRVCRRWNSCVQSKRLPLVVSSAAEAVALSKLLSLGRFRANSERYAPPKAKRMLLLAPPNSTGVGASFAKVLEAASTLEEVEIRLGRGHWGREWDPLGIPVRRALKRLDLRLFEVVGSEGAQKTALDVRHFADLLASWPNLAVLKCNCEIHPAHRSIHSGNQPTPAECYTAFPISFPPNLHTLHLGSEYFRYVITAITQLLLSPAGTRLRELRLTAMPLLHDDFPSLVDALGQVAPHLRVLTLTSRQYPAMDVLGGPLLNIDTIFPLLTSAVKLQLDLRILSESTILSFLLPLVRQHALRDILLASLSDYNLSIYPTRLGADDMLDFLAGVRPDSGASSRPLQFVLVGQISQAWTREEIAKVKEVADREGSGIQLYLA